MAVQTLNDLYLRTLTITRPAIMKYKREGRWIDISPAEFADTVRHVSAGLRQLGVKAEDRVAILSDNRPEWTISDFAILAANAVTVPIYATLTAKQIEFILQDSGAAALIASNREQIDKVLQVRRNCPALRALIMCDGAPPADVLTFESVVERGRSHGGSDFEDLLRRRRPDDLATIVYTSGTTGNPKGAMLTHGNIASNVVASCSALPFGKELTLSFLPLSHILERMADFAYLHAGGCIAYAENVQKVPENLQELRPEVFVAVPRVFEKLQTRIMDKVAQAPQRKQKIFRWALQVGEERLPYRVEHKSPPFLLALKAFLADKLVFSRILERLGGKVRFVFSGGAPLSPELAAFFIGAGLEVYEGYGLTETSPVIAVNTPNARKLGTVGRPIPGVEVKIAPDGEILTRGPHVMKGYFNNPEATREAIDPQGWFHTGDIGELDAEGFLKITDRKKDILVNAYGKNIAPQPIEALLKQSPYVVTPVLIGDRRKFVSALIVPNFERLERDTGVRAESRQELANDERVRDLIQGEIDRVNSQLSHHEQIRQFRLLPEDFTIESGELTPSLKVKRRVVDEKYKELIDAMYAEEPVRAAGS